MSAEQPPLSSSELDDFFNDLGIDTTTLSTTDAPSSSDLLAAADIDLDFDDNLASETTAIDGALFTPTSSVNGDAQKGGWSELGVTEKDDFLDWLEKDDQMSRRESNLSDPDDDGSELDITELAMKRQETATTEATLVDDDLSLADKPLPPPPVPDERPRPAEPVTRELLQRRLDQFLRDPPAEDPSSAGFAQLAATPPVCLYDDGVLLKLFASVSEVESATIEAQISDVEDTLRSKLSEASQSHTPITQAYADYASDPSLPHRLGVFLPDEFRLQLWSAHLAARTSDRQFPTSDNEHAPFQLSNAALAAMLQDTKASVANCVANGTLPNEEKSLELVDEVVSLVTTFCEARHLEYDPFLVEIGVLVAFLVIRHGQDAQVSTQQLFERACLLWGGSYLAWANRDVAASTVVTERGGVSTLVGLGGIAWGVNALSNVKSLRQIKLRSLVLHHDPMLCLHLDNHVDLWNIAPTDRQVPLHDQLMDIQRSFVGEDGDALLNLGKRHPSEPLLGLFSSKAHGIRVDNQLKLLDACVSEATGFETIQSASYFLALSLLVLHRERIVAANTTADVQRVLDAIVANTFTRTDARASTFNAQIVLKCACNAATLTPRSLTSILADDDLVIPLRCGRLSNAPSYIESASTLQTDDKSSIEPPHSTSSKTASPTASEAQGSGESATSADEQQSEQQQQPAQSAGEEEEQQPAPSPSDTATNSDAANDDPLNHANDQQQQAKSSSKGSGGWFTGWSKAEELRDRLKQSLNEGKLKETLQKTTQDVQLQLMKLRGEEGVPYNPPPVVRASGEIHTTQQLVEFNRNLPMGMRLDRTANGLAIVGLLRSYEGEPLQAESAGLMIGDLVLTVNGMPIISLDRDEAIAFIAKQDNPLTMIFFCERPKHDAVSDEDVLDTMQDGEDEHDDVATPQTSTETIPGLREALEHFYGKQAPGKVKDVPSIMEIYRGREFELLMELSSKYYERVVGDPNYLFPTQYASPVSADEIVSQMYGESTNESPRYKKIKYTVVDCRPDHLIKMTGRFPTSFLVSPEQLTNPEELEKLYDTLQSLKTKTRICIMGSGGDPLMTLYDKPAAREIQEADRLNVELCAFYFLRHGFPFVCSVTGGFASAYLAMRDQSLNPVENLVDRDLAVKSQVLDRLDQYRKLKTVKSSIGANFLARAAKHNPSAPVVDMFSNDYLSSSVVGESGGAQLRQLTSSIAKRVGLSLAGSTAKVPAPDISQAAAPLAPESAPSAATTMGEAPTDAPSDQQEPGSSQPSTASSGSGWGWGSMGNKFKIVSGDLGTKIKESIAKLSTEDEGERRDVESDVQEKPDEREVEAMLAGLEKGDLLDYTKLESVLHTFKVFKQKKSETLSSSSSIRRVIVMGCSRFLVLQPHMLRSSHGYVKSNRSIGDVVRLRFKNNDMAVMYLFYKRLDPLQVQAEQGTSNEVADAIDKIDDPTLKSQCYRLDNPQEFVQALKLLCAQHKEQTKRQQEVEQQLGSEETDGAKQDGKEVSAEGDDVEA